MTIHSRGPLRRLAIAAPVVGLGFHFPDIAPGASFCNPQSNSPGFHVSD